MSATNVDYAARMTLRKMGLSEDLLVGKGLKVKIVEVTLAALNVLATAANMIPAGAIPLGVSSIVLVPVVTSAASNTYNVGVGADDNAFGALIAGALGTQSDLSDHTVSPLGLWGAAAQDVIVDAPGVETFTSGSVKLRLTYLEVVAPSA